MTKPEFGMERQKGIYEKYNGSYVVISISGKSDIGGKVDSIKGNIMTLNPFQDGNYNGEDKWEVFLSDNPLGYDVSINAITGIKPTTRKTLENIFGALNRLNNFPKQLEQPDKK